MKDLTNSHVDEYRNARGIVRLQTEGHLVGIVGDVVLKLEQMVPIRVSGMYADGSLIPSTTYDVPTSIVNAGAVPIMEYLLDKYGVKSGSGEGVAETR